MMAFAQLLAKSASKDELVPFAVGDPIQLVTDKALKESALKVTHQEVDEESLADAEITIGVDEMEEWGE